MPDVEQFVVQNVVQHKVRYQRRIKEQADDDRMVGGVITAQDTSRSRRRPCQPGSLKLTFEVIPVDAFEVCIEILPSAPGNGGSWPASACCARVASPSLHLAIQNETTVDGVVLFVDCSAINLSKEDQRKRLEHGLGCVGEQVTDPNQESVVPHPRRMCQSGERKEFDVHFRKGC